MWHCHQPHQMHAAGYPEHVHNGVHACAAEPVSAKGPALVAHTVDQLRVSPRGCEQVRFSCCSLSKLSRVLFQLHAQIAPSSYLLHFLSVGISELPETGVRACIAVQGLPCIFGGCAWH